MVLKSSYRGFVAPVFTPFTSEGELNLSEIPKYAEYLKKKNNVNAVLVNGTVGEGVLMSNDERKKLADSWVNAANAFGQLVMVHVGGTNLNNVVELAKHAESVGAWTILCLPDLFFRPKTIDELIDYMKIVGAAAPKTPLFYYHYPLLTGVNLDMSTFLECAYSQVPTLCGLKYTHNNLDEGTRCVQLRNREFTIFLGSDQLISAAFCMGFDSMILTILNFAADEARSIKEFVQSGKILEAQKVQNRIRNLTEFVEAEMQWINGFKAITSLVSGLNLGNPRLPLKALTPHQSSKLATQLKLFNRI